MTQFEFRDETLTNEFNEKGYVIIPLLSNNEVAELLLLYNEIEKNLQKNDNTIYTTGEHISKKHAIEINNKLKQVIDPLLSSFIKNYDPLMSAYIVKPPLQKKEDIFNWHQDLSFVDENKYQSAQVWIALQDTKQENGTIQVIDKTHTYNNFIRTAPIFPPLFSNSFYDDKAKVETLNLKPGETIIFNHRLLHCSPANLSEKERIAIITTIKPKGAQWYYYYNNQQENQIEQYEADLDFYLDVWINNKVDKSKIIKKFEYAFPQISK
jgi:hypothetical protein